MKRTFLTSDRNYCTCCARRVKPIAQVLKQVLKQVLTDQSLSVVRATTNHRDGYLKLFLLSFRTLPIKGVQ